MIVGEKITFLRYNHYICKKRIKNESNNTSTQY